MVGPRISPKMRPMMVLEICPSDGETCRESCGGFRKKSVGGTTKKRVPKPAARKKKETAEESKAKRGSQGRKSARRA